jgi:hypothetical protein
LSKLFQVLTDLAIDPNKQTALINNPDALMDEANLSEVERAVIMSREAAKIAAIFAQEEAPSALAFADPTPDPEPDPDPEPEPDSEPDESFR